MADQTTSSARNKRLLIVGLIIISLLTVGTRFYSSFQELATTREEIEQVEAEIEELETEKEDLKGEIERVNSEEFIESMARTELGMVKEGEILYITVD